jgi:PilZ domain
MSHPSLFGHRAASPAPETSAPSPSDRGAASPVTGGSDPDRRRNERIPLALRGRYMLEGGRDYPCVTRDVSRMGMAIRGVPVGAIGERVIAYLEELGRIEGRIVRRSENWFAIELVASPQKLDRLDEKIIAILRRRTQGAAAAE